LSSDYFAAQKTQFKKRRNFVKAKNINDPEIEEKEESDEKTLLRKERQQSKRVCCYVVGLEIDMKLLLERAQERIYGISSIEEYKGDVIYVSVTNQGLIIFFDFGSVVFWGFHEETEKKYLKNFEIFFKYKKADKYEQDTLTFVKGENFNVVSDRIILSQSDNPLERIAISYALAQSTILSVYEDEVDLTIDDTRRIPSELAVKGSISLSKKEITKNIGAIFVKRSSINLHSDMLDTPLVFWEYQEWEPIYNKMRNYLDIDKRLEILNKRLDILKELYDMLNNEIKNQNEYYLEWIIIWLIVIEVLIEVVWKMFFKDIFGFIKA
jgi:uncharacterized Rmd1/YagE family protein